MKKWFFIFLLCMPYGLQAKKEKKNTYKQLIEAIYNLDPYEVRSGLHSLSPLSKETKSKLLRIAESILAQEAYKKSRIKKRSLLQIAVGGLITLFCLLYLYQDDLTAMQTHDVRKKAL